MRDDFQLSRFLLTANYKHFYQLPIINISTSCLPHFHETSMTCCCDNLKKDGCSNRREAIFRRNFVRNLELLSRGEMSNCPSDPHITVSPHITGGRLFSAKWHSWVVQDVDLIHLIINQVGEDDSIFFVILELMQCHHLSKTVCFTTLFISQPFILYL